MKLRPFFSFYGAKWRAAPRYPAPEHSTVIEPFAGSAGYSVRHAARKVLLYDTDEKIVATWRYLIGASEREIRALPLVGPNDHVSDLDVPQEARWLIGWWLNKAAAQPHLSPSAWMRDPEHTRVNNFWGEGIRERVARQVSHIRHWRAEQASYEQVPDIAGTWFVDPPYSGPPGRRYAHGNDGISYDHLAAWCRSRPGHVMVCENVGADWLPFEPFMAAKAAAGRGRTGVSKEALWLGGAS